LKAQGPRKSRLRGPFNSGKGRLRDGRWQGAVIVGRGPDTGEYVWKFFYGRTRQECV
jgi:hypothetical protein